MNTPRLTLALFIQTNENKPNERIKIVKEFIPIKPFYNIYLKLNKNFNTLYTNERNKRIKIVKELPQFETLILKMNKL